MLDSRFYGMAREKSKRHSARVSAKGTVETSYPGRIERYGAVIEKRAGLIAIVLVVFATARIAATYSVYSHTSDEPAHIACGMEWLDRGVYRYEAQHPPLARMAAAIGPYLMGKRSQGTNGNQ